MGGTDSRWIVAVSRPQQEAWAARNVQAQGFDAYYPKFEEEYLTKTKRIATRIRTVFPRYLFVRTDGPWYFLLGTFGISNVVFEGENNPATMPDAQVEYLREREDALGLVKLPPKPKPTPFTRGQRLRVTYGPMQGLTGICQGDSAKERVTMLLDMLGRKSSVVMQRGALEAA